MALLDPTFNLRHNVRALATHWVASARSLAFGWPWKVDRDHPTGNAALVFAGRTK